MSLIPELVPTEVPPKNGKDPVIDLLERIIARLDDIESMQEDLLEKVHELESSLRYLS